MGAPQATTPGRGRLMTLAAGAQAVSPAAAAHRFVTIDISRAGKLQIVTT